MALNFGKSNRSVAFNPTSAFPLDARSYFESYDAALAAAAIAAEAGDTNTVYYYGETVCVVENSSATLYIIQPDKTLKEVGSVPTGDNLSIEVVDGELKIHGFGTSYYKYIPAVKDESGEIVTPSSYELTSGFVAGLEPRVRLNADSKLEVAWYEPSTETIEGVNSKVDSVQQSVDTIDEIVNAEGTGLVSQVSSVKEDVKELENKVGSAADSGLGQAATGLYAEVERIDNDIASITSEIGEPASGDNPSTGLYAEIDKKADASSVYTKEDTDSAIANAVAGASHLKRVIVDSLPTENIDENTIYLMKKEVSLTGNTYNEYMYLNGAWEIIGDTTPDLTDYAKTSEVNSALEGKVDKVDGSRLMTSEEAEKLARIEAGAQVNLVKSVNETDFTIDTNGKLNLNSIDQSKVNGLTDVLNGKVSAEEGKSLVSDDLITKLETVQENAEANFIKTVDELQFKVDDLGNLTLLDIAQDKVSGLSETLQNKVNTEVGKGLSSNDFTDALKEKLENMNANAMVNVLESISLAGTPIALVEKNADIPIAGATLGVVLSSNEDNKVSVAEDGTMSVNSLSISKLTQAADEILILNGGSAG